MSPMDAEAHLLDAMAAWFSKPCLTDVEPRGLPIYPHEYEAAEALAEKRAITLRKEANAWYASPFDESGDHDSPHPVDPEAGRPEEDATSPPAVSPERPPCGC